MKLRVLITALVVTFLPLTQACIITNRDIETLREQVRLAQKNVVGLQKKTEEHSIRLEGIENSLQMIESRVEDNTERMENMKAGVSAEVMPVSEFVISEPEEPLTPGIEEEIPAGAGEAKGYEPRPFIRGEDLYKSAYGHFEKGEYGQAILEFEEYVANYSKTELSDNAQYWIGECYYSQKDYRQAIREFEKVEKNFPEGNKISAAKLKKGLSYYEIGNLKEAVRELTEVVNRFPDSEEILLAKEKLKRWK